MIRFWNEPNIPVAENTQNFDIPFGVTLSRFYPQEIQDRVDCYNHVWVQNGVLVHPVQTHQIYTKTLFKRYCNYTFFLRVITCFVICMCILSFIWILVLLIREI